MHGILKLLIQQCILCIIALRTLVVCEMLPLTLLDGNNNPILYFRIGSSVQEARFLLNFNSSETVTWINLLSNSASYSDQFGGSDIFYFGSSHFRMSTKLLNTPVSTQTSGYNGIMGLSRSSPIWNVWYRITLSSGSIFVNDLNPALFNPFGLKQYVDGPPLICDLDSNYLCSTTGIVGNKSYTVKFFGSVAVTLLPSSLYYELFNDFDIYRDNESVLPTVNITFPVVGSPKGCVQSYEALGLDSVKGCIYEENNFLFIKPERYIHIPKDTIWSGSHNGRTMLIKPNYNDSEQQTIYLGTSIIKDYFVHINLLQKRVIIKSNPTMEHLSDMNIILIVINSIILSRWVLLNEASIKEEKENKLFKCLSIKLFGLLSILLCVLFSSIFKSINYYTIICLVGIFVPFVPMYLFLLYEAYTDFISIATDQQLLHYRKRTLHFVIFSLQNSKLCNGWLLLIGIWLCLVDRRGDIYESNPSLMVALVLIALVTHYLFKSIKGVVVSLKGKGKVNFSLAILIKSQIAFCYPK